ncbi:MAG: ribonuclease P protein component [Beijerinckiaceae bacterium]
MSARGASPSLGSATGRIRKRAEFQRAAKGLRLYGRAFSLQAVGRSGETEHTTRFGFTVTKRVGNAVERARIRRRLKEAVRTAQGLSVRPGHDYVLLARREALSLPFAELSADVGRALAEIGMKLDRQPRGGRNKEAVGAALSRQPETDAPRMKPHD